MNKKSILILLAGIIITAFSISVALAPLNKLQRFQRMTHSDSLFMQKFDSTLYQPGLRELSKELAYSQSLIKLAASDSIQMVLNLSDSSVMLSIKGVIIHKTKVQILKKDKIFDRLPLEQELSIFSNPLPIITQRATIVKEPVVVRQAPKDTAEAAINAYKPDTLIQNPAYALFTTACNIQIILEQETKKNYHNYRTKNGFYMKWYALRIQKALGNVIRFKQQDYEPVIRIKMPVDDLRTIYRALPVNPFLVIKL